MPAVRRPTAWSSSGSTVWPGIRKGKWPARRRCPQVLVDPTGRRPRVHLVYRDEEHGNRVCLATARRGKTLRWRHRHLTRYGMNRWEPVYDTERWKSVGELHILLQRVAQVAGETPIPTLPTPIFMLTASRL